MRKVLLALLLGIALVVVASSSASPQTQPNGAFRADVVRMFTDLTPVAAALDQNAGTTNNSSSVAAARRSVKALSPKQLAVLEKAFSAYPAWRSFPARLAKLVARLPQARLSTYGAKITPNDCVASRAPGLTQEDIEIAADVSFAATAVLEAVPQDSVDEVGRGIAVALWAVPTTIERAFDHLYNVAQACDADDQAAQITAIQTAVNSITGSFTAIQTAITTLKTDVDTSFTAVNTATSNIQTAVNTANTAITAVQTAITALKLDVDNSFTVVNTAIGNVQTGVNTANTKLVTLTAAVAADNDLNIRLHIEEDLANPGNHPIALFELPASQGGYLEVARSIVADIIAKMTATGQGAGNGASFLASGDASRAAGKFKAAYADYGKAYQAAAR